MNTKKLVLIGLGAGLVLGMVAVALFSLFPSPTPALAQSGAGPEIIISVHEVVNGETFAGDVRISYVDAPELPAAAPAASGLFLGRDGNLLHLGAGGISVEVDTEQVNGEEPVTTVQASHDGETVTVQVTAATAVYADTTPHPDITPADIEAGSKTISRTVAPGSVDEIGENSIIRVWGSEQNGQIVADVLVHEPIR